uniref:Uncharacterized protein n=1 Tax=Anguilla anguilla TaxID=7936 RepID=A0A0E9WP01_ANGAN
MVESLLRRQASSLSALHSSGEYEECLPPRLYYSPVLCLSDLKSEGEERAAIFRTSLSQKRQKK